MQLVKKAARYFAQKKYCRTVIATQADLSAFQKKPTFSMIMGTLLIILSYVIGLPAVVFLAALAVWMRKPLIGIIGGPLIYAISMVVFVIGIRMAGLKHIKAFCAWITRAVLEKILGDEIKEICVIEETATAADVKN